jgi:hypothetical protein
MRGWTFGLMASASCLVAGVLVSCSTGTDCDFRMCASAEGAGDGGVGNSDGAVPEAATPPDCKEDADSASAEARGCIVDNFAVFVNGDADNGGDGTKGKPLKTIGAAITKALGAGKRRVYICGSAAFAEHLSLTSAVSLYGGFSCASWEPDANAKPKVAPSDKGYALHIDNVSGGVTISDLELDAFDASGLKDGTSSIAVFASKSKVAFVRTAIRASNGAEGAPGAAGADGKLTTASSGTQDAVGNPASGAIGGLSKECTCSSGLKTLGGVGGSNGSGGGNGEPKDYPPTGSNNGGAGGPGGGSCDATSFGKGGADAPPATNAMPPAKRGVLGADGWVPSKGDDATEDGKPGQGGGGGGAINTSVGGSGGGCGGCGGLRGTGSGGGGASIAILANQSAISVNASMLETKLAGVGGIGGAGGAGLEGGIGGTTGSCQGGKGGHGANGGAGAGGAGGVAIGILYTGTAPIVDSATTYTPGTLGKGGKGGKSPENDGPAGIAENVKDASQL